MIKFSEIPINPKVSDLLFDKINQEVPGGWSEDKLRTLIDEGCAAAIAAIRAIDDFSQVAYDRVEPEDIPVVQMVILTMMSKVLNSSIDLAMAESYIEMILRRPQQ